MIKTLVLGTIGALAVGFLAIQAIPYGRNHTNPPVVQEPAWDSAQTRQLAVQACYDCHSNQTVWPWYTNIAPVSWLVQRDVQEGREKLNFSEMNRPQKEAGESAEKVAEGEMPMLVYVLMHPEARLSADQKQALVQGLEATLGSRGERRPGGLGSFGRTGSRDND